MKYKVQGSMEVICWAEIEANSPDEALKIAKERSKKFLTDPPVDEPFRFEINVLPSDFEVEDTRIECSFDCEELGIKRKNWNKCDICEFKPPF